MSAMQPFNPVWGSNQLLTANGGSQVAPLSKSTKQVHLENTGTTNPVYVRCYLNANGTSAATTADFRLSPGTVEVITKFQDFDRLSYISASGTTLEIIEGEGW